MCGEFLARLQAHGSDVSRIRAPHDRGAASVEHDEKLATATAAKVNGKAARAEKAHNAPALRAWNVRNSFEAEGIREVHHCDGRKAATGATLQKKGAGRRFFSLNIPPLVVRRYVRRVVRPLAE